MSIAAAHQPYSSPPCRSIVCETVRSAAASNLGRLSPSSALGFTLSVLEVRDHDGSIGQRKKGVRSNKLCGLSIQPVHMIKASPRQDPLTSSPSSSRGWW